MGKTFTDYVLELVGKPMTDPDVKTLLKEYGFPRAKKDDALWKPSMGLSIRATRLGPPTKRFLGVGTVTFCASIAQEGLAPLPEKIIDYAAPLPFGLDFKMSRAAARKKMGKKPDHELDEFDTWWFDKKDRKLFIGWTRGKLDSVSWATRWP